MVRVVSIDYHFFRYSIHCYITYYDNLKTLHMYEICIMYLIIDTCLHVLFLCLINLHRFHPFCVCILDEVVASNILPAHPAANLGTTPPTLGTHSCNAGDRGVFNPWFFDHQQQQGETWK